MPPASNQHAAVSIPALGGPLRSALRVQFLGLGPLATRAQHVIDGGEYLARQVGLRNLLRKRLAGVFLAAQR